MSWLEVQLDHHGCKVLNIIPKDQNEWFEQWVWFKLYHPKGHKWAALTCSLRYLVDPYDNWIVAHKYSWMWSRNYDAHIWNLR